MDEDLQPHERTLLLPGHRAKIPKSWPHRLVCIFTYWPWDMVKNIKLLTTQLKGDESRGSKPPTNVSEDNDTGPRKLETKLQGMMLQGKLQGMVLLGKLQKLMLLGKLRKMMLLGKLQEMMLLGKLRKMMLLGKL